MPRKRNYRKEYDEYQGLPEQKKRRAERNKDRRAAQRAGRVHKGDNKEVDHLGSHRTGNLAGAPPQPRPQEDKHLTRAQVRKLIGGANLPHVRLAVILLYTTAARASALCGLTWDRCDFDRDRIDLRDPTITRPHKGRAIVPMLRTAKTALREAEAGALSGYVIEWAGKRVKSLKRGIKTARTAAGIAQTVSPHILRHSAAVHMAEDGRSMEEIQQFLGHSDINVTRKIYARFSPSYLKEAAAALEFDDLGSMNQCTLPKADDQPLISLENLVGATGIEPVTPTMSR